jgi:hypothetical protein
MIDIINFCLATAGVTHTVTRYGKSAVLQRLHIGGCPLRLSTRHTRYPTPLQVHRSRKHDRRNFERLIIRQDIEDSHMQHHIPIRTVGIWASATSWEGVR